MTTIYDPKHPLYLDEADTRKEMERVFDLCHGCRLIKKYASERRDRSMASKLASELLAASNGEGGAIKRRDEMHRMADANRAFAHFRW